MGRSVLGGACFKFAFVSSLFFSRLVIVGVIFLISYGSGWGLRIS